MNRIFRTFNDMPVIWKESNCQHQGVSHSKVYLMPSMSLLLGTNLLGSDLGVSDLEAESSQEGQIRKNVCRIFLNLTTELEDWAKIL